MNMKYTKFEQELRIKAAKDPEHCLECKGQLAANERIFCGNCIMRSIDELEKKGHLKVVGDKISLTEAGIRYAVEKGYG
jgi:hypothetical protein